MNDNRNHTPAGQPVTQPLYNGSRCIPRRRIPRRCRTRRRCIHIRRRAGTARPFMHSRCSSPYITHPYSRRSGRTPRVGAKGAAPRGLPPFVCDHDLFADTGFVDDACNADFNGVRREFYGAEHHWRLPPTAYYLISSIASFLSIVLPFSFFLFFGKRKLSDTVLVEKNGVLNSVLLVFAGLAVSV